MNRIVGGSYYLYTPNKVAPVCFVFAFVLSGVVNARQSYRRHKLRYMIYHPTCCLLFTIAFALRAYGTLRDGSDLMFHVSETLMHLAM